MADRPIIRPRLLKRRGNNRFETFGGPTGIADNHGSAPWTSGGTIVALTSGLLNPVITDGVLACGWCSEASAATAAPNPPYQLTDPHYHFPWNLRDMLFYMSITNASAAVGQANSAPQLSAVTVGASYAIIRPTSGSYDTVQMLDSSDTTNTLVTVVEIPTIVDGVKQTSATYNGIVLVQIIPSKLNVSI